MDKEGVNIMITALLGSSRGNGNTEYLTKLLLDGIDVSSIIALRDYTIQPIEDHRHSPTGFPKVNDDYDQVIMQVLKSDIIIFSTPLYWYGMSGLMKNFIDRWTESIRDNRFDFKAEMSKKSAYVIITGGDDPKIKTQPLIQQFNYIFEFVGLDFADYLIGEAVKPGDIENDKLALLKAEQMNQMLREKYA